MTNEEAKEIVKRIKGYMDGGECWSESEFIAMDMAIKALSQKPCEKCEVGNPCLYCKHEFIQKSEPCDDVTPSRRKGYWEFYGRLLKCSECGKIWDDMEKECPNCGIEMEIK